MTIGIGFGRRRRPIARGAESMRVRQIAVAAGLAVGDGLHRRPDARLERGARRQQRQVEPGQPSGEIGGELPRRLGEERAAVAGRRHRAQRIATIASSASSIVSCPTGLGIDREGIMRLA